MKRRMAWGCALAVVLVAAACDKSTKKKGDQGHGHGHDHGGADSGGVVARLTGPGGAEAGYVELKLHDDKGDLELWIARDAKFATPLDLPLDSKITVTFTDKGGKTVTMAVRNRDRNEDEDGKANVRDGKTNYFIFPGDSGQDAAWLKGSEFLATVKLTFEAEGKAYSTPGFVLRPHTHGGDHGHDH